MKTPRPDWSWLILLSAATSNFFMFGSYSSFSVYFIELVDEFGQGNGITAWIGALASGTSFLVGPLGSWLITKLSCRAVVILGAAICTAGFIASSFVTNIYVLYFTYGILTGVGFGISHVPGIVSVGYHFSKKHRTLATALAMAGGGAGQLGMPPITRLLVDCYGWRGSMWLQAGLALQLCWCGALLRPIPSTADLSPAASLQSLTLAMPVNNNPNKEEEGKRKGVGGGEKGGDDSCSGEKRVSRDCHRTSILLSIGSTYLWAMNIFVVIVMVCAYSVHTGEDPVTASFMVTVLGTFNTTGRVVAGLLTRSISSRWLFAATTALHGVSTALIPLGHDFLTISTFTAGVGLFYGMKWGIFPAVLADMFGLERLAQVYGYSMFAVGLGGLTGPPLAGWLVDMTGTFREAFLFGGAVTLLSTVLIAALHFHERRHKPHVPHIPVALTDSV